MGHGVEFVHAGDGAGRVGGLVPDLAPSNFRGHRENADRLNGFIAHLRSVSPLGGILYFPPRRYIIGVPSGAAALGENEEDLIVPDNITLQFAPGARLVSAGYAPGTSVSSWRPGASQLPQTEALKVRIGIYGRIEAPMMPIFDTFMEDPRGDAAQSENFPQTEAGRIIFARPDVRAVYPEWWGAVPLVDEGRAWAGSSSASLDPRIAASVRRTTAALQAALDAAFNFRIKPQYREQPFLDASQVPISRDGHPVLERVYETPVFTSIPVVLANDYAIDRPLRVGATVAQAMGNDLREYDRFAFPNNPDGLVIRGECGPSTRRFGAALIKAAPTFRPPTRNDRQELLGLGRLPASAGSQPTEVSSMLVMRTGAGITVENVVFDAAERAERCITFSAPSMGATHHNGLEGCEFRNARVELVHIGGEMPSIGPDPWTMDMPPRVAEVDSFHFSGDQDYSSLRIARCRFYTGQNLDRVRATLTELRADRVVREPLFNEDERDPVLWRIGLMFRAGPALGVELFGCTFDGPASPMILALGGRLSLQNCAFRTDVVPRVDGVELVRAPTDRGPDTALRWWNGTDIYIARPFDELPWLDPTTGTRSPPLRRMLPTTITARNIRSHSRQFITTWVAEFPPVSAQGAANMLLMNVQHRNGFLDGGDRPAVYWGGPRPANHALVLQGCLFGPGRGIGGAVYVARPGEPAPVVDLGSRRLGDVGPTSGDKVFHGPDSVELQWIQRLGAR